MCFWGLFLLFPLFLCFLVADLNAELKNAQNECLTLTREVHDLEHSAAAAEKVAREKYNFCREGEQILIYK